MSSDAIRNRFERLTPFLDKRLGRIVAAAEANAVGYGGISIVVRQTGVSRRAIAQGREELKTPESVPLTRVRKKGAGRKGSSPRKNEPLAMIESLQREGDSKMKKKRYEAEKIVRILQEAERRGATPYLVHAGEALC